MIADTGLTKKQAQAAMDAFFQAITDELARGGQVQIAGFGSFRVSERSARTARNPRNGEAVEIPARKVPVFKAGATLKQAVA